MDNWIRIHGRAGLCSLLLAGTSLAPRAAHAQDAQPCFARPGQTTPPCIVEQGRLIVETGLAAWTRTQMPGGQSDELAYAASDFRFGLAPKVEAQFGWSGMVETRTRFTNGHTQSRLDPGDVSFGLLYGLTGANGPVALQVFATAPTGRGNGTAGEWTFGTRLPVAIALDADWQLGLTPEFDLAANGDGRGRHASWGGSAGLSRALSPRLGIGFDISAMHAYPEQGSTRLLTSMTLALLSGKNTQIDMSLGAGLNRSSPAHQIYVGISRMF